MERRGDKTWAVLIGVLTAVEVYALLSKGRHMSLSEWVRLITGQHPRRRDRPVWAAVLTAVLVWFLGHICLGWGPSLTEDYRLSWRSIHYAHTSDEGVRPS